MQMTLAAIRNRHAAEERNLVVATLDAHGWSVSAAARELGVAYSTMYDLVIRHGLQAQMSKLGPGRGRPKSL